MKRHAIIISCEDYVEFPNISFCHADNILMQETLCRYCDYEYNNLLSLTLYLEVNLIIPKIFYRK